MEKNFDQARDAELLKKIANTVKWHTEFTKAWKEKDLEKMLDLGNDICVSHLDLLGDDVNDPNLKAQIALELVRTKMLVENVREKNIS